MSRSVKPTASSAALEARSISVHAGDRQLLSEVSLRLFPGRVLVVLGPNGAGKSSLIRALVGILPLKQGEILLEGSPLHTLERRTIARRIAVVPQQAEAPEGLSVREVVLSGRAPHLGALLHPSTSDIALVDATLRRCALEPLAERSVHQLSGGEFRRALVARALVQQTPLLLLDEPTAHLDVRHVLDLIHIIRHESRERLVATLVVVHDFHTASLLADDVLLLEQSTMVAYGSAPEVLRRDLLEQVFRVRLASVEIGEITTFFPLPSAP